jgi:hypothetical protein
MRLRVSYVDHTSAGEAVRTDSLIVEVTRV